MARVQKYPSQISALISESHYERLKVVQRDHALNLADVIREAIAAGLPTVEDRYATLARMEEARYTGLTGVEHVPSGE